MKMIKGICLVFLIVSGLLSCETYSNQTPSKSYGQQFADQEYSSLKKVYDSYTEIKETIGNPNNIWQFVEKNKSKMYFWEFRSRRYSFTSQGRTIVDTDVNTFWNPLKIIGYSETYPRSTVDKKHSDYVIFVDMLLDIEYGKWMYYHEDTYTYIYKIYSTISGEVFAQNIRVIKYSRLSENSKLIFDSWQ